MGVGTNQVNMCSCRVSTNTYANDITQQRFNST